MSEQQLRRIEQVANSTIGKAIVEFANFVGRERLAQPQYDDALIKCYDQILTAIKEGIEVCRRCKGKGAHWDRETGDPNILCETCGGKGWVMK